MRRKRLSSLPAREADRENSSPIRKGDNRLLCGRRLRGELVRAPYHVQDGKRPRGLLGVILGFFGGELLLLCLKTVLKKDDKEEPTTKDLGDTGI